MTSLQWLIEVTNIINHDRIELSDGSRGIAQTIALESAISALVDSYAAIADDARAAKTICFTPAGKEFLTSLDKVMIPAFSTALTAAHASLAACNACLRYKSIHNAELNAARAADLISAINDARNIVHIAQATLSAYVSAQSNLDPNTGNNGVATDICKSSNVCAKDSGSNDYTSGQYKNQLPTIKLAGKYGAIKENAQMFAFLAALLFCLYLIKQSGCMASNSSDDRIESEAQMNDDSFHGYP